MTKATVDKLGAVHGNIADWCIAKLAEEEPIMTMTELGPMPTGQTRKSAKSSDVAVMVKFLNDNNISADLENNSGLGNLKAQLDKKQRKGNVAPFPLPTSLDSLKVARDGG